MAESEMNAPVVVRLGGEDVSFARMTMRDYKALEEKVRAARHSRVRSMLNECNVGGAERFRLLSDATALDVSMGDVDQYVGSYPGTEYVLTQSLKKAGKADGDIEPVLQKLDFMQAVFVARAVVGFAKYVALEPVSDPQPEKDPNG